ncbi:ribulokinase [Lentilactobacillus farraginis DSM 18382 = JCM 14108]|uniref:Ribulokinase n=1 Tax=Lentilactobacillus farraginis DSM 18382 = JCM 14108 TaxID=1423743 RepID=X0PCG6_9LACO|nr:ribulokinase [Lentilactobacillus farraginis DSM 18382 = JCM 14108]
MDESRVRDEIVSGNISLGIELGSTRIKEVLVTNDFQTIASGDYLWENELDNGIWTYPIEKIWMVFKPATQRWHWQFMTNTVLNSRRLGQSGLVP